MDCLPRSHEDILSRYAAGERHFVGLELDLDMVPNGLLDIAGAVLDGADFSHCWFTATFVGASLKGAKFNHANVKCCDFSRADLTDADFRGAAMEAATWGGAKLLRTKFGDVSLYGAHLSEAKLLESIEND